MAEERPQLRGGSSDLFDAANALVCERSKVHIENAVAGLLDGIERRPRLLGERRQRLLGRALTFIPCCRKRLAAGRKHDGERRLAAPGPRNQPRIDTRLPTARRKPHRPTIAFGRGSAGLDEQSIANRRPP
jgi:transposase InsO family protein